jgi:hypothetical protein
MKPTPEGSRDLGRHHTEAGADVLTCGASWPHLQIGQSLIPTWQSLLHTSVLHHLNDCIYAILLSRFDLRAQDLCLGLYISTYPLPEAFAISQE